MNAIVGDWGNVIDTSIIGIHQVLLGDGRVLYWGGDGNGNAFSNTVKYGIFDPATGQHEILSASHVVRMFCGAGVIIPGTDKVLISGGNGSGDRGGQIFDLSDEILSRDPANDMNDGRFYPTTVSLSTGQVVVLGGKDAGTPEIFTLGEGWRDLSGATDSDVKANWWYPRAWVNADGEVLYIAVKEGNQNAQVAQPGTLEIMALDPSGEGSIRQVGDVPFPMDVTSPAAMYDVGKVVMMDHKGDLWIMDINGETPTFAFAADLNVDRNNSDMTALPDGRVLINGGTTVGNSQNEANAVFQSVIFDPYSGDVAYVDSEAVMRLYHSSTVLLADGTILSMGGGGLGGTKNFMDAQIYSPDYLFNDDGTLADRPEITDAPDNIKPGQTFTITVDDASSIARMSFVKTGAVTHSINMESGRMDLNFKVLSNTQIEVSLPDNPHVLSAGNWMLFAWNDKGVPSKAPILSVDPTLPTFDGIGDLRADYFVIDASVTSLDQIDFDAAAVHTEMVTEVRESSSGAFYPGGPADDFAIRYTGEFTVSRGGDHTFYLTSDDGARLFINGQEVVDNDGMQAPTLKAGSINLGAGNHTIELRYFEGGGPGSIDLDWAGPGFARKQMTFDGVDDNLIVNGSFERGEVTANNVAHFANAQMPGWNSQDGYLEIQENLGGKAAASGNQWLELDRGNSTVDAVYQDVQTQAGKTYELSFATAQRPGTTASSNDIEVYWNGDLVAKITSASGAWNTHIFEVEGTGGKDRLEFREPAGANDGGGSLIDSVVLKAVGPEGNVIVAEPGGGYLEGTDGDDIFVGGNGLDVFYGGLGNDRYDGAGGDYNQVDYDGSASDYTFTLNDDGSITAEHSLYGTDILENIGGVWFTGEAAWYSVDDLVTSAPGGGTNVIVADDAGGYLGGTAGDDEFRGGAGVDVFYGGEGNDRFIGGGGDYNQVDYDGAASDYTFTANDDGTITAQHAQYGTDVLEGIGGVWFYGEGKWYSTDDLVASGPGNGGQTFEADEAGGYLSGTDGDDLFIGKGGTDTFYGGLGDDTYRGGGGYNQVNLDGGASDYIFTLNDDGSITSTNAQYGTDLLIDIGGIWFADEGKWYSVDDLAKAPDGQVNVIRADDSGGFLSGTAGADEFIGGIGNDTFAGGAGDDIYRGGGNGSDYDQVDLDGAKNDYTFQKNTDGTVSVYSAAWGQDLFDGIDGVWFRGEGLWSSVDDLLL